MAEPVKTVPGRARAGKPAWDRGQIRVFVKEIKRELGPGWDVVGPRVQRAFLAEGALRIILLQSCADLPMGIVRELLSAMLSEAGL